MGYEYYIHTKRKIKLEFLNSIIDIIKKHPLFFRQYTFNNQIRYEFRDKNNHNLKDQPNFEIIIEDENRIYILENAKRDFEIWRILKQYLEKNDGYSIENLQE